MILKTKGITVVRLYGNLRRSLLYLLEAPNYGLPKLLAHRYISIVDKLSSRDEKIPIVIFENCNKFLFKAAYKKYIIKLRLYMLWQNHPYIGLGNNLIQLPRYLKQHSILSNLNRRIIKKYKWFYTALTCWMKLFISNLYGHYTNFDLNWSISKTSYK